VPIPILIRKLGYQGKCRECKFKEVKDIITKFKEKAKEIESEKDETHKD
jgi:hypothetical protein